MMEITTDIRIGKSPEWVEADRLVSIIFDKKWGENHPAMRKLIQEALEKFYKEGRDDEAAKR